MEWWLIVLIVVVVLGYVLAWRFVMNMWTSEYTVGDSKFGFGFVAVFVALAWPIWYPFVLIMPNRSTKLW